MHRAFSPSLRLASTARSSPAVVVAQAAPSVRALGSGDDDEDSIKWQMDPNAKYGRVMLKISGEALQGESETGVDPKVLQSVAREVAAAHLSGVQVAIVVGGGNYFRGAASAGPWLDRATADYVGMLATVMNAIMLQSALEALSKSLHFPAFDVKLQFQHGF